LVAAALTVLQTIADTFSVGDSVTETVMTTATERLEETTGELPQFRSHLTAYSTNNWNGIQLLAMFADFRTEDAWC